MSLKRYWHYLLLPPAAYLFYAAFRDFPLSGLRNLFVSFGFSGLLLLIFYESAAWVLMGERWRYFCRENGASVGPGIANAARLAGFAWSYITPGPHVGGEPAQVLYLRRRGYALDKTLPALVRDRSFELFSGLLTASLLIVLPGGNARAGWISALAAAVLLTLITIPVYSRRSFRALAVGIFRISGKGDKHHYRIYNFLMTLFHPAGRRKRPLFVQLLLFLSLLMSPLLIFGEIGLFFRMSGVPPGWRAVFVLAAVSRIAHYAPIPGALGVYDAGMIGTAAWLGLDPTTAAAYVLFTRLRDLLQVGLGMLISYLPPGAIYAD